jgi:hypothetical protein
MTTRETFWIKSFRSIKRVSLEEKTDWADRALKAFDERFSNKPMEASMVCQKCGKTMAKLGFTVCERCLEEIVGPDIKQSLDANTSPGANRLAR